MLSQVKRVCDTERDHCSDATRVMSQASAMASRSICSAPAAGKASLAAADTGEIVGSWQDGLLTTRSVVRRRLDLAHRGQVRVQPLPVGAAQAARRCA